MMMVFIDESGNLGKDGRFFVISALVPKNSKRIKNLAKQKLLKLKKEGYLFDELKGSKMSFPQKQDILFDLCKTDDFYCFYIVADKNHISSKLLEDKNICYNYLASFLFEKIMKQINDDLFVILDNHSIKNNSINSLSDYIRINAYTNWGFNKAIMFGYKDSRIVKNLQIVDLISNVIYAKYIYGKDHLYNMIKQKIVGFTRFPSQKFNT